MNQILHVYHTTLSGPGNSILNSILENGMHIPDGRMADSLQTAGVFVTTGQEHQKKSIKTDKPLSPNEIREKGRPVIIELECDLDDKGWTIDYEENEDLAKAIFFDFQDELCEMPPTTIQGRHGPLEINEIKGVYDTERDGLIVHLTASQGEETEIYVPWDEDIDRHLKNVWKNDPPINPGALVEDFTRRNSKRVVSCSLLIETLREYLAATLGERYLREERDQIRAAIARGEEVSLKYSGQAPMKIRSIEMFKTVDWVNIDISGHEPPGQEQNHDPDPGVEPS